MTKISEQVHSKFELSTRGLRGLQWLMTVALAQIILLGAGCEPNTYWGPQDLTASLDLAVCDGYACTGGCDTNADCKNGFQCDPVAHVCVQCEMDTDCPMGEVCTANHTCAPGCSARQACLNDGSVCEVDAGVCVGCLSDGDCKNPLDPRCDPVGKTCVPCLPTNDNCGYDTYCESMNGSYACVPGCKTDNDCVAPPQGSDGGTSDGGSSDGGSSDGGASDGGSGGQGGNVGGLNYCDQKFHVCVRCLTDSECPRGKLCQGDVCVDGCTAAHGCPTNNLSCCNNLCVDESVDSQNCGGCNTACGGAKNCCSSACSNPVSDVLNCGGCGIACSVANGTPGCAARSCTIASCNMGWADCDGLVVNGCETNTNVNLNDCGGCGNVCALAHAQSNCANGMCGIASCSYPYFDCNMMAADGCEVNVLAGDLNNCGGCGQVCAPANASPQCESGVCKIAACNPNFADCNGQPDDGCEINTQTSVANCGGCGSACITANAVPACTAGVCGISMCTPGYADCNQLPQDGCEINTVADPANCGGCNMACSSNNGTPSCVNSACQIACSAGYADCNKIAADGCEVNINNDPNNCNGCGTVCSLANAVAACGGGNCTIASCKPGFLDCNGLPGDGCEVDSTSDALNCNGCGKVCSTTNGAATCVASACRIACNPGYADCNNNAADGCEVNLFADPNNCSTCGEICSTNNIANRTCGPVAGVATCNGTCAAGYADCDNNKQTNGCETNVATDANNCGACNKVCSLPNATSNCSAGSCGIASCSTNYADCDGSAGDGCEVNIQTSLAHCGGCATPCSGANMAVDACTAGACTGTCQAGYLDCDNNLRADGCEVNGQTDSSNCGGCSVSCSTNNMATHTCGAGVCNGTCAAGFADCDLNKQTDGCEQSTNTVTNCGPGGAVNGGQGAAAGCGAVCSAQHGVPGCATGSCTIACDPGYANCNNVVGNTGLNSDGCETNTASDPNNCGVGGGSNAAAPGCGVVCSNANIQTPTCSGGVCNGTCSAGFADCDGNKQANGCEASTHSVTNCGPGGAVNNGEGAQAGCGNVCSTQNGTPGCATGSCTIVCNAGYGNCDGIVGNTGVGSNGCEVTLATSNGQAYPGSAVQNCGACGTTCSTNNVATESCAAGVCTGTCNAGYGNCNANLQTDGCEANLNTSDGQVNAAINHCGACGTTCAFTSHVTGTSCGGGACNITSCGAGHANCNGAYADGCEIDTTSNPNNCGACGTVCNLPNATAGCAGSNCTIVGCDGNFGNCDGNTQNGCETNLMGSDAKNCGACNTNCAFCVLGICF